MSDVKLGLGRATGMFYHAPAGTALPTDPTAELASAWVHVGDISDTGITFTPNKSTENIKNWALEVKRVVQTDHSETIQAPIMDTTEEVFKTIVGEDNVTTASGVTTVNMSAGSLPPEEAFLFLMNDGEHTMGIGCSYGQISAIEAVSFSPTAAINWTVTITATSGSDMKIIKK